MAIAWKNLESCETVDEVQNDLRINLHDSDYDKTGSAPDECRCQLQLRDITCTVAIPKHPKTMGNDNPSPVFTLSGKLESLSAGKRLGT